MAVARTFKVTKPPMTGPDIKTWKKYVIAEFKMMKLDAPIDDNNIYNVNTRNVSMALATAVGLDAKEVFKNGLGPLDRRKIQNEAGKKPNTKTIAFRKSLQEKWNKAPAKKPVPKPVPPKKPAVKPAPKPTPKPVQKTLNGIDVSSAQPANVTSEVKCDFVVVKATEGTHYVNSYFTAQMSNAKHSGKLIGLYHFADTNPASLEAQHFVNTIRPYIGSVIPVLDFEGPALANGPKWAMQFMDRVVQLTGIRPLIYGSRGNICLPEYEAIAKKYGLWMAAYPIPTPTEFAPETPYGECSPWTAPTIYQYSDVGKLEGYSGELDLDVFYGDADDWRARTKKS